MSGMAIQDQRDRLAERIRHLEAQLSGALEAASEEAASNGEMFLDPPATGMGSTIRALELEIEALRTEEASLG